MQLFEMYKSINNLTTDVSDLKEITDVIYNLKAKDIYFNNKYNQGDILFNKENVQVALETLADVIDKLYIENGQSETIAWNNVIGKPFENVSIDFEVKNNILSLKQNIYSPITHTHKEYTPISHSDNINIHLTNIEKEDLSKIKNLEISNKNKYDGVSTEDNKIIFKSGNEVKSEVIIPNFIDETKFAKVVHAHNCKDVSYANSLYPDIENIEQAIDKLLYKPLTINFSCDVSPTLENGVVVNAITFNWNYNKDIVSQSINGLNLNNDVRTHTELKSFSSDKKFSITSSDGVNEVSKSIEFKFYDGLYYGTSHRMSYNSDFILNLNKELTNTKSKTFTLACEENEYIYYSIPSYFGEPSFNVGGFYGGFIKDSTIEFTNISGHKEYYDIYRSSNSGLGNTTVMVK